jgi:hypothetical protein
MERKTVDSSMLSSIGYDSSTSTLEVEFKNNGIVWQYHDVPEDIYNDLMAADSAGKYFLANIKGKYSESKVD